MNIPINELGFINKQQAAKMAGFTMRTIDNWMHQGIIPYYKIGRSVLLKASDITAAIEKCRILNTPQQSESNDKTN